MKEQIIKNILEKMNSKNTEELLKIWIENDEEQWTKEALESIKHVLIERGEELPIQKIKQEKNNVKPITLQSMKENLESLGVGLIGSGIIQVVFISAGTEFWGMFLIVVGLFIILFKKRGMFIVVGICLILAGIINFFISIIFILSQVDVDFQGFLWLILGVFQFSWGIQELRKYRKYRFLFCK